jgi:hypothetical protein
MQKLREQLFATTPKTESRSALKQMLSAADQSAGYRGGRQPGAISQTWREILSQIYWGCKECGFPFLTAKDIIDLAKHRSIIIRPSEVYARMKQYAHYGYVDFIEGGGYIVTEYAAKRFSFFEKKLENDKAADANPTTETPAALDQPPAQGREAGPGGGT